MEVETKVVSSSTAVFPTPESGSADGQMNGKNHRVVEFLKQVPIINYIVFMLTEDLTQEDAVSFLNTVALLDALIVGLVIGMMMATSFDELTTADLRGATDPDYCWTHDHYLNGNCTATASSFSSLVYNECVQSVVFLSSAMVGAMYVLCFLAVVAGKRSCEEKAKYWMTVHRPAFPIILFFSIFGIVHFINAMRYMVEIKYPNTKIVNGTVVFAGGRSHAFDLLLWGQMIYAIPVFFSLVTAYFQWKWNKRVSSRQS
jgi:hypothetical protein